MKFLQKITLDLTVSRLQNVHCSQDDKDSRNILITLSDNGVPYIVPDDVSIHLKISKPDSTYVYIDEKMSENLYRTDNKIGIILPEQATTAHGISKAEIQLIDKNKKETVSTTSFNIVVKKSVLSNNMIISKNDSNVISDMIYHLADKDNPHKITKEQIGLENVDNTHDINKNVNSAKKLTTTRNINGTLFDGTTDITTDKWGKLRTVKLSGDVSASKSVDGSADIDIAVEVKDNSHNHTISNISDLTATVNELNVLDGITATTTELNYTDGVTSNIQSQLDSKAPMDSPSMTGTPKAPTASAGTNTSQIATTAFTQTEISNHNTSPTAHANIRNLISDLTTRLNALADSDDTTLDQLSEIVAYIKSNRTLIENVTTNKVNVSDIVDNLTSTSTNKPLSAKQGKILKDLIDSLTTAGNFEESDMFLAYLASNNNGPLCLFSQTVGDTVTTGGRSGINSKGAKSLIFNGSLYNAFNNPLPCYGGHVVVTVDGTSWEDNDVNDNYGMQGGAGEAFTTPAGNTVYIKNMAGAWNLGDNRPVTAVLNGKMYTIKTRTFFRYSPSSLKWALELADFYLFKTNLSIINYNNVTPIINGIKSLSTVGTLGYGTNNDYIPNIACLSFWNGKYNDDGSNLSYCNKGAFGDIVTHAASDFVPKTGGKFTGKVAFGDKASIWTDGEGGNIEIISKSGTYGYQMDADTDSALRLYCFKTNPWTYLYNLSFNIEGYLSVPKLDVIGNAKINNMRITSKDNSVFHIDGGTTYHENYSLAFTQFGNLLQLKPSSNGGVTLGTTDNKFSSLFANNVYNSSGLITSSDRNKKKDFAGITQEFAEQIIDGLVPTSFKYKDGDSGRIHYGLVAQDVEKLLEESGIDSKDFAPLIKEYPKKEIENEDGNKTLVTDYDAEPEYFLRYEGFIGLIIKYIQGLKQENNDLKDKMSQLENRLELLKSRLNNI